MWNFYSQKQNHETNVEEEYCWAITRVVGSHAAANQVPVCFELSEFKVASLVHNEVDRMYTHFGLR